MLERDKEGRPKMYGEILRGNPDPKDPFWDYRFMVGFSMPLARYAYKVADEPKRKKRNKAQ